MSLALTSAIKNGCQDGVGDKLGCGFADSTRTIKVAKILRLGRICDSDLSRFRGQVGFA